MICSPKLLLGSFVDVLLLFDHLVAVLALEFLDEWIGNTLLVNFFLAVEALTT
jgi:hypothetical protein